MLLAIGLGPLVHRIERAVPTGARALPRWFAILVIYLAVVAPGDDLSACSSCRRSSIRRRTCGSALPQLLDHGQAFLIRHRLLSHRITLEEAVQQRARARRRHRHGRDRR